jgi:hypothetical protein
VVSKVEEFLEKHFRGIHWYLKALFCVEFRWNPSL